MKTPPHAMRRIHCIAVKRETVQYFAQIGALASRDFAIRAILRFAKQIVLSNDIDKIHRSLFQLNAFATYSIGFTYKLNK
jgi:hypothetical protein